MPDPVFITASYAFTPFQPERLDALRAELAAFGEERGMKGLTLLAEEGINATVSGSKEAISAWKARLTAECGPMTFKDSAADGQVFMRWSVKIKPEIVALKDARVRPAGKRGHVSPDEWDALLRREDVVIVDTRNTQEVAIGRFPGAVDPGIRSFSQFPAFVRESNIPRDKTVLMYCTGGIRCEKALLAMEAEGYSDVRQLDGGILAYLEAKPDGMFEGECFVFDHRVAVDAHLRPSQTYGLCPHCGDPGAVRVDCRCGMQGSVCDRCAADETQRTCSKRCRNLLRKAVPRAALTAR